MKRIASIALCLAAACALSGETPTPAAPDQVHQVMFLVTINKLTGVWTHAQVVGGFSDNDACVRASATAGTLASMDPQFDPNDVPVVLCPKIALGEHLPDASHAAPGEEAPPYDPTDPTEPVKPATSL